jgi:hypothetical protein
MSAYFNVYVGAYAIMPTVKLKIKEKKYGCSNTKCANHSKMKITDKFCSLCGSQGVSTEVEKEVKKLVDWYSFAEENGFAPEFLYSPGETGYLIGNQTSYGDTYSEHNRNDYIEFGAEYITEQITRLNVDNAEVFEAFKKQYGEEIKVVFGSFHYYS